MNFKRLQELRNDGTLDDLYRSGIITPKAYLMLEANNKVRLLIKQTGVKKSQAVKVTAKYLRCTPKTIYQYLSMLEEKKEKPFRK